MLGFGARLTTVSCVLNDEDVLDLGGALLH